MVGWTFFLVDKTAPAQPSNDIPCDWRPDLDFDCSYENGSQPQVASIEREVSIESDSSTESIINPSPSESDNEVPTFPHVLGDSIPDLNQGIPREESQIDVNCFGEIHTQSITPEDDLNLIDSQIIDIMLK